jgi:hypothetical protein
MSLILATTDLPILQVKFVIVRLQGACRFAEQRTQRVYDMVLSQAQCRLRTSSRHCIAFSKINFE